MTALARMQEVIRNHRVTGNPSRRHTMPAQDKQIVLDVLVDLLKGGIFQQRAEPAQRLIGVELRVARRTAHRQIPGLARLPAERIADDLAPKPLQSHLPQAAGKPYS